MIARLSMLPGVGNSRLEVNVCLDFWRAVDGLRRAARVLVAVWVLNCGLMAAAGAGSLAEGLDLRRHGPLFEGLAEPPPAGLDGKDFGKALLGEPMAPFAFSGVMHITDPKFESDADYVIDGSTAVVNTHDDVNAHLSGVIRGTVSPGLMKLGAGTLALSGANTYSGTTYLLQGGLQVRSNSAWGSASLQAAVGTRLEYAPGVVMSSPLHVTAMKVEDWAPSGSYGAVVAPEHADKLRWAVESGEAVHAGLLQGSAPFVKLGAGRLNLVGDAMGYGGAALVSGGTLAVNEMFGGSVAVDAGARLEGAGMVGSTRIRSGGTLAPGNSIGTLMINGDLHFESGGHFEVEVDPDGTSDAVLVGGKALLAGDVMALASAGDWQASTRYTLLTAAGGLDGTRFDSVSVHKDFAFLEPTLSYDLDTVTLTLVRNGKALDDVAETPDEKDVADVIDGEGPAGPGGSPFDGNPVLRDELLVLDRARARQALQQLSGSWSASVRSGLAEDSRFLRQSALGNARAPGAWGRAFFSSSRRDGVEGVAGDTRTLQGLVVGVNREVGGDVVVGGYLGVQQAKYRRDGVGAIGGGHGAYRHDSGTEGGQAAATVQGVHLGLVASGQWQPLRWSAGAAHTWHTVKSQRRVAFGRLDESLRASYQAGVTQMFAEVGWPVWWQDVVHPPSATRDDAGVLDRGGRVGRPGSLLLEPFVGFAHVRLSSDSFDERGGAAALSVLPVKQAVSFSTLGVRMTQDVETRHGMLRLQGQLAWRHAGGGRQVAATQYFREGAGRVEFASHGVPVMRSAWSLDLGVTGNVSRHASVSLAYAGQFARGVRDHGVRLNMRWVF
ncbi:MAG: autotransporter outer membrane beta-barrel domain-containing protein [Burkholderiaceae bacterium]|nr:MAG: autotransporter outer membrane beta-barrel domain-containing protein [Burkholderiaceae bacterium]TAM04710.1 MAG: autotransporter outer membrane beta-barrel domain-containing protein [Pusillimonas sp.]